MDDMKSWLWAESNRRLCYHPSAAMAEALPLNYTAG